jgi:hypothetical protein
VCVLLGPAIALLAQGVRDVVAASALADRVRRVVEFHGSRGTDQLRVAGTGLALAQWAFDADLRYRGTPHRAGDALRARSCRP